MPRFALERFRLLVSTSLIAPVVHAATGIPVDVIFGMTEVEADIAARAVRMDVGGYTTPVAAREDLVTLKILAGRPKDLEDIRELLKRSATFDAQRTRKLLTGLEAITERSDLVPLFEGLLRGRA